jgi:hypothetical protein
LAEAEMELADHRVPTGITGGNVFRKNGSQALEAGLRAVQVTFGDRTMRSNVSYNSAIRPPIEFGEGRRTAVLSLRRHRGRVARST